MKEEERRGEERAGRRTNNSETARSGGDMLRCPRYGLRYESSTYSTRYSRCRAHISLKLSTQTMPCKNCLIHKTACEGWGSPYMEHGWMEVASPSLVLPRSV